jgi:hypothetical protein
MRIASRVFWLPKDLGYAEEYEDACAVNLDRGRAAIADGVSSAIFSGAWARILTSAVIAAPPDVTDPSFWDWLAHRRREWSEAIDPLSLTFFQRGKMQQVGGAFATLLWLEWQLEDESASWKCTALGDGGLLHVRNGQLLEAFPIAAADELNADPLTVASIARSGDQHLEFRSANGSMQPGDWLVLTTDALLGWALKRYEAGLPPDWDEIWEMNDEEFTERVQSWRDGREARVDDTTLVMLNVEQHCDTEHCESTENHCHSERSEESSDPEMSRADSSLRSE